MTSGQIRTGKITKVVHVRFATDSDGGETNLDGCHGYGIIQGSDKRDVFFVDTAVQDVQFTDLEIGQNACYVTDVGPLGIAAKVWVATSRSLLCDPEADASLNRAVSP